MRDRRAAGMDGDVAEEGRVRAERRGGVDRAADERVLLHTIDGVREHGAQVDEPRDERHRAQEGELAEEAAHGGVVAARA